MALELHNVQLGKEEEGEEGEEEEKEEEEEERMKVRERGVKR